MKRGFTLIEFLLSAALAGVVSAAIATTLVRQQHFYSAAQERLEIRDRLSEAANILTTELRAAAVSDLGVPFMSDSAIEVFLPVMSSIACTVNGSTIGIAPVTLSRGNTLTSGSAQPDTGDIALIYGLPYNSPDSGLWYQHRIAAVASRAASITCPASSGFTIAADVANGISALQVVLTSAAPVRAGAPIQFMRRSRYSLYRSADGWYLGYRRCNVVGASVCGSIQPVAGPYHSYSSGTSGLTFRYFNSAGAMINASQSAALARIDVVVRSALPRFASLHTPNSLAARESVVVRVSPRNRVR